MRLVLVGLMAAQGACRGAPGPESPDLAFLLLDFEGEAVGDAQAWLDGGGTRYACETWDGGLVERAEQWGDGWSIATLLAGRWTNVWIEAGPSGTAWRRRRGVQQSRATSDAPAVGVLLQQPLMLTAAAWPCGMAEAHTVIRFAAERGLDVERGVEVPVAVSLRERRERVLDGETIAAVRYLVQTPGFARTLWLDEQDRLLEAWPAADFLRLRREGLAPLEEPPPPMPDGVDREPLVAAGEFPLGVELTLPRAADTPVPGVVLVHGSGDADRDGNSPAMPTWVERELAGQLSAAGYAVARYDKRGSGESHPLATGPDAPPLDLGLDALAGDTIAVWEALRQHPRVAGECTFLVGHSEGTQVAVRAQLRSPASGLVLLAPPMRPLDEFVGEQLVVLLEAHGATPAEVEEARIIQRALLNAARAGDREDLARLGVGPAGAAWFTERMEADPAAELARVEAPVLAVFMGQDLQISARDQAVAERLAMGARLEVVRLPGLDHLLRATSMPGTGAYLDPDLLPDPSVAVVMEAWLQRQPCVASRVQRSAVGL
ncbi:MAG: alpha/beta hydrolase [Pseudomonadota bacterium]